MSYEEVESNSFKNDYFDIDDCYCVGIVFISQCNNKAENWFYWLDVKIEIPPKEWDRRII